MFSAYCQHCQAEMLLSTRRIEALGRGEDGIVVVFRCWKGHLGTWRTGRPDVQPPRNAVLAVA